MNTLAASQETAAKLLDSAAHDQSQAAALLENPADYFRRGGIEIPDNTEAEFNSFFFEEASYLTDHLPEFMESGQFPTEIQELLAGELRKIHWFCIPCQTAAWTVAGLIVAAFAVLGAAAFGPEAAVVGTFAAFVGCSAEAASAFLISILGSIGAGPAAVVQKICKWTKACA